MKNLMKVTFIVAFVVALLGVVNAQKANAITLLSAGSTVLITGTAVEPLGTTEWDTATGVDFVGDYAEVDLVSGDFGSILAVDDTGTYTDFLFAGLPVAPLWDIEDVHFDLLTLVVEDTTTATRLDLSGTGLIYSLLFDPTPGIWTLSADGAFSVFSFSSTTRAVPEPGTIALLGMGLVGLIGAGARRKLKKKS